MAGRKKVVNKIEIQREIKLQKVKDVYEYDKLFILFNNGIWLEDIYRKATENIDDSNEFQVHAHTLNISIANLILVFPLTFFSIPQTCSTAHIDYKLDDIKEYGDKCKDVAKGITVSIVNTFGFSNNVKLVYDGLSIHRHPGCFGFSATDTSKTIEPASVIYRNLEAHEKHQIDCILCLNNGHFSSYRFNHNRTIKLHTAEGKIINVSKSEDGENIPEGVYKHHPTISVTFSTIPNELKLFYHLLEENEKANKSKIEFTKYLIEIDENSETFQEIINLGRQIINSYTPSLEFIKTEHYKEHKYRTNYKQDEPSYCKYLSSKDYRGF